MTIGERLVSRYLKHPTAADAWTPADAPLDAGSAMVVDSNMSHLALESCRHLVASVGPGGYGAHETSAGPWQGLLDDAPVPSSYALQPHNQIPWDFRSARRFGPFVLIADRATDDGAAPRAIRCATHVTVGSGTTVNLYWALTRTPSGAALSEGQYLAFQTVELTAAGTSEEVATLEAAGPTLPWASQPGRASAARGRQTTPVALGWVWFGWRILGTGTSYVNAFSAFEVR